ncbi:MAG: MBL fold metallo-hydrolase [Clostridiales bacterium]|nr:MBL fold metallo-hydrolase [Clostridiales bacterium]
MARFKKKLTSDHSLPSLFDDFEIAGLSTQEKNITGLPGMERHIRLAQAELQQRRVATMTPPLSTPGDNDDKVFYISFGSGSSGNCTFVGTRKAALLIDAGIDDRKVEAELTRNRLSMDTIQGIILTHDHGDHIRYAYSMLRRNRHMALYCTPRVLNGILRRHNVSRRIKDYHHAIYKEIPFELGGFTVTAFEVDHDGSDNAGFYITRQGFNFTVATDLGHIGARADHYIRLANYLMIESNYDLYMLRHGRYPEYLKARIEAGNGHMDNEVTAAYLASIYNPGLKHVFLCHLSHDNNTPQKALSTVCEALAAKGIVVGDGSNSPQSLQADIQVIALPRYESTGLITMRHIPSI